MFLEPRRMPGHHRCYLLMKSRKKEKKERKEGRERKKEREPRKQKKLNDSICFDYEEENIYIIIKYKHRLLRLRGWDG